MVVVQGFEPDDREPPEVEEYQPQQPPPGVPARVLLAFNFVAMCNQHQGLRTNACSDEVKCWRQDLPPKCEAAYNCACNVLGEYFSPPKKHSRQEIIV